MRARRVWAAALCGATAIALGACGVQEGENPTAGCTDETRSAGEPGDAAPLLVLGSSVGAPTVVYADGAVVVPLDASSDGEGQGATNAVGGLHGMMRPPMMAPGYYGDQPGGYIAGWLSDCELEAVAAAADDLLQPGTDFGDPQVTDSPSTPVTYYPDGGDPVRHSVYAFWRADPDEWSDLTRSQAQARVDLAALWDAVEDAATLTDALEVDRLHLTRYGSIDDIVLDWSLPQPSELIGDSGCVTIDDPGQVTEVLTYLDAHDGSLGVDYHLAVTAAAPGLPACG